MKRTWKQIASLFLAFCMIFTMLPGVAFAETVDVDSGTPLGMSGTITAFAELSTEVVAQQVSTGTAEDELSLPNELTVTLTEDDDTGTMGSDASKQTQTTMKVSGWTSSPVYDGNAEGVYAFTPGLELPDGITVADGVSAPTITVTVDKAEERNAVSMMGASDDIAIDAINFPDENFRNWLLNSANIRGMGADGVLSATDIAAITYLYLINQNISSLEGIKYFTALT